MAMSTAGFRAAVLAALALGGDVVGGEARPRGLVSWLRLKIRGSRYAAAGATLSGAAKCAKKGHRPLVHGRCSRCKTSPDLAAGSASTPDQIKQ